ncbi:jg16446 [Pararge aegeria aegeria]|uniref:Jg16446 protein n=1 Tax=Pararge aegeria aegeria TaxID=348720 RepID=A0A8S4SRN6_9NEOP|nr:jg16446 [Pararge aegeria aegeria]
MWAPFNNWLSHLRAVELLANNLAGEGSSLCRLFSKEHSSRDSIVTTPPRRHRLQGIVPSTVSLLGLLSDDLIPSHHPWRCEFKKEVPGSIPDRSNLGMHNF